MIDGGFQHPNCVSWYLLLISWCRILFCRPANVWFLDNRQKCLHGSVCPGTFEYLWGSWQDPEPRCHWSSTWCTLRCIHLLNWSFDWQSSSGNLSQSLLYFLSLFFRNCGVRVTRVTSCCRLQISTVPVYVSCILLVATGVYLVSWTDSTDCKERCDLVDCSPNTPSEILHISPSLSTPTLVLISVAGAGAGAGVRQEVMSSQRRQQVVVTLLLGAMIRLLPAGQI